MKGKISMLTYFQCQLGALMKEGTLDTGTGTLGQVLGSWGSKYICIDANWDISCSALELQIHIPLNTFVFLYLETNWEFWSQAGTGPVPWGFKSPVTRGSHAPDGPGPARDLGTEFHEYNFQTQFGKVGCAINPYIFALVWRREGHFCWTDKVLLED